MSAPITERLPIADELLLDAKAFRENTVYDSDGDPIRLIANAERMEAAADVIAKLCTPDPALARLVEAAMALIASRDKNCSDIEVFKETKRYGSFWSPSATMVDSSAVAALRQALKTWSAQ